VQKVLKDFKVFKDLLFKEHKVKKALKDFKVFKETWDLKDFKAIKGLRV
jgi:hypothetical protein